MADTAVVAAERTLPHNLEAERSVLGAILVHNDAFNLAAQVIDSGDFYRDAHRRIFDKMVALNEREPGDRLRHAEGGAVARRASSTTSAGPAYIASLADGVPRATNVEYYARIVKEKSTLRNLIFAANKILTNAYEADQESDLILDEAESAIFAVADDRLKAGFVADARSGQGELPEDRAAVRAEAADHRRADRVRRPRRDDARAAGRRSDHRRRPAVDGEDEPGAEHRAVRGRAARSDGRVLQPRNVEGVAVPPPADVGGADRQPPPDERRHRAEGLRPHLARARDAERDAAVHRRHREHRRARNARQGAAAARRSTASACSWSTTSS